MPDEQAHIQIVISGQAQGLEEALAQAQASLGRFGGAADHAATQTGTRLAEGEAKAAHEATALAARVRVAADAVGLLGVESTESVAKIFLLRDSVKDLKEAFGGLSGAITGGLGAALAFGSIQFMKDSVDEAMNAQGAWDQLTAAYKGNKAGLDAVTGSIEGNQAAWEKLGVAQGDVAAMALRLRQAHADPTTILGDPTALADTAAILHTTIPDALQTILSPKGGKSVLNNLGLSPIRIKEAVDAMRTMSAQQRALYLEGQVETHGGAGQGAALAGTAAGSFKAFGAAMSDLKEQVGTALLPLLTSLAQALTHLLSGLENITRPFGGLANVLKALFIPMLLLGLKLFLGLKGSLSGMVDQLLGRTVGAFAQTAESMSEADAEARTLDRDIRALPETWTTVATFVPATLIKDAYKANIFSIPKTWTTVATFIPATVTEPAMAPVTVPVQMGALTPAVVLAAMAAVQEQIDREPAPTVPLTPIVEDPLPALRSAEQIVDATPLVVPIEVQEPSDAAMADAVDYLRTVMQTATIPVPVIAEVTAQLALPAPDALAATMDWWRAAIEQREAVTVPVHVAPLSAAEAARVASADQSVLNRAFKRVHALPIHEEIIVTGPLRVPLLETTGVRIGKVIYSGKPIALPSALPVEPMLAIDAPGRLAAIRAQVQRGLGTAHLTVDAIVTGIGKGVKGASYVIDGVDHVTDKLSGIYTRARSFIGSHPLSWTMHGVGTNAAFAGSFAVADALFTNAKFNAPDINVPVAHFSAAQDKQLAALKNRLNQPLTVKVQGKVDIGTLGSAVVGVNLSPDDKKLILKEIAALEAQKRAADRFADASKHPIPVQIDPKFDWGEIARMIGEVAVGTIIANVVTRFLDPTQLLNLMKGGWGKIVDRFTGKNDKNPWDPNGPGGGLGNIIQLLPRTAPTGGVDPGTLTGSLVGSTAGTLTASLVGSWGPALVKGLATLGTRLGGLIVLEWAPALVSGLAALGPMLLAGAAFVGSLIWDGISAVLTAGVALVADLPITALIGGAFATATAAAIGGVASASAAGLDAAHKKQIKQIHDHPDSLFGNLGTMLKNLGKTLGGAFKGIGSALGNIGGTIVSGIVAGVTGAYKLIVGIGSTIIEGISTAVKSGIINLINGILTMFNNIFRTLSNVWGIGKAFEHLRLPLIPPIPAPHSGGRGRGSSLPLVAGHQAILTDLPTSTNTSQSTTVNATFHINSNQDAALIARQIERALSDFVQGARSQRRLVG